MLSSLIIWLHAAAPLQIEPLPAERITLEVGETRSFRVKVARIAVTGCSVTDFDVRNIEGGIQVIGVVPTTHCPLLMWLTNDERRVLTVVTPKVVHAPLVLEPLAEGALLRLPDVRSVKVVSGEGVVARVVPEGVTLSCKQRGAVVLEVVRDGAPLPVTYEVDLRKLP
jgi:hypothetical protein